MTSLMASSAWPSEYPTPRLKEIVATGNCPWWPMVRDSFCVRMCMKALRGTGVEAPVALLLELPLLLAPAADVLPELEPELLALSDAAEPPVDPDNTVVLPVLVEEGERAEVELTADVVEVVLARFSTEGAALRDEPLLLERGVSSELPEEGAAPEPAPEEEPAVFDAATVGVPVCEDWI